MKNATILAVAVGALIVASVAAQNFTYVGPQKCEICHRTEKRGRQYPIWEQSEHSQSFAALSLPAAAEKAKASGVSTPPPETPYCLNCHSPLYDKAPDLKANGVSCEVCHGPGSEYRKLAVMKDKSEAVRNGLFLYGGPDKIKAFCLNCHQNAHGMTFDFPAAWEKIKHPIPKG